MGEVGRAAAPDAAGVELHPVGVQNPHCRHRVSPPRRYGQGAVPFKVEHDAGDARPDHADPPPAHVPRHVVEPELPCTLPYLRVRHRARAFRRLGQRAGDPPAAVARRVAGHGDLNGRRLAQEVLPPGLRRFIARRSRALRARSKASCMGAPGTRPLVAASACRRPTSDSHWPFPRGRPPPRAMATPGSPDQYAFRWGKSDLLAKKPGSPRRACLVIQHRHGG